MVHLQRELAAAIITGDADGRTVVQLGSGKQTRR
jgi:hypothetical protein